MDEQRQGDAISGTVTGAGTGPIAIGKNIEQHQALGDAAVAAVTEAEREQVRLAFAQLREQVAAQAPEEQRAAAVERVEELEQEVFAGQPDLTTIQYVTRWFRRNLPTSPAPSQASSSTRSSAGSSRSPATGWWSWWAGRSEAPPEPSANVSVGRRGRQRSTAAPAQRRISSMKASVAPRSSGGSSSSS